MIDCTLRKTVLTNPPVDPEACLLQLMQSSPPEEFLNLLINGIVTPTHTNWISEDRKKFTKTDFSQLLAKCEAPRVLSEIGRILKLDDLSAKIPHFVTSMNNTFHTGIFEDDTPHYDDIKINATSSSVPDLLPSNHDSLLDSLDPVEIKRVLNLLHNNSSLIPSALLPALHAQDFNTLLQFLLSTISKGHKEIFMPYFLPPSTQFQLFVSGHPPVVQIRSNQIKSNQVGPFVSY